MEDFMEDASRRFVLGVHDMPALVARYLQEKLELPSAAAFYDALRNGRVVVSLQMDQDPSDRLFKALMTPIAELQFSDDRYGTLVKNGLQGRLGPDGRVFQYVEQRMVKGGRSPWRGFGTMCRKTFDAMLEERLGIPKNYRIPPDMKVRIEAAMREESVG